ncbi:MAG: EamA family transporter RarD [Spirochaetae bacterium HGW-Spirochaetae-3]|jgi:chloramphenicol-sensitive protein RarD|nr:MAG: EamA family transporter RarD [Spirochaetae bacterium HGW-Spirochaetae-3]
MGIDRAEKKSAESVGMLYGIAAYSLWGLFPLYWKRLATVPSVQILMHRVVWAFVMTAILSLALGRWKIMARLFREPRRLAATIAAGFLVTANWGIYIWAVNSGRIIETSLGYYLNPLVSVALGNIVLKERIDKGIIAACVIAAAGIAILTVSYGKLPWVSLTLAGTFALYGLIKKMAGLDALAGLAMETAPVFPFAVAYLVMENAAGRGAFGFVGATETVMLVLAGAVTAVPLLFFAEGVKRVPLSRLGFLQYISPTSQLLLGVFVFGETLSGTRALAFAFILAALLVFALSRRKLSSVR